MNFAFSEEQEQFRQLLRRFVQERWPVAESRRLASTDAGYEPAVWEQMARELGLQGLAIPEEHGGQGFGAIELGIALEELGRELAGGPLFATCALATPALLAVATTREQAELLPGIASGDTIATLAPRSGVRAEGLGLRGEQRLVIDAQNADLLLVAASDDLGTGLYAVHPGAPGVAIEPVDGLDLTRKVAHLRLDGAAGRRLGRDDAGPALEKTLHRAVVALAADQVGGAARCLETAVDYVKARVQFGRPVGSFQAVKHRAADAYTVLELARSVAYWSWWVATNDGRELAEAAHVAKSLCAEAFRRASRENIHLHGGMGFTWEHDAHLYYRRAQADEVMFGDPLEHRGALARQLGVLP
ncbi:MAG: acyl-CoA dehydrogenase family protein [Myxococcota bacterium]|nr:acyl-CoA dehydrogenase family protein [Myxococcota bacterium]